ncbi:MAG: hypothetical protein K6A14_08405 [Erysipelotrichaceae bacterium]|nr:hypothetical protein [Erysipelotrichaceae bacterium]
MEIAILGVSAGKNYPALILEIIGRGKHNLSIISEKELPDYLDQRAFDGFVLSGSACVSVISRLDALSPLAQQTGYVNVIVNNGGKLTGYNTLGYGVKKLLEENGIDLTGCQFVISGNDVMNETLIRTVRDLGGITAESSDEHCSVLINTSSADMQIDLAKMDLLDTVIDLKCPPLRSRLVYESQIRGLKAVGGLEVLINECLSAYELITGEEITSSETEECRKKLYRKIRNIVIIGMPTAGKTTISEMVRQRYGKTIVEMDDMIEQETGMSIADYFSAFGEEAFRDRESGICLKLSAGTGAIISTGGGVIKRHENMVELAANSLIIWLDRELPLLQGSSSRPLSRDSEALKKMFEERKELYGKYSDMRIENNMTLEDVMKVLEEIL